MPITLECHGPLAELGGATLQTVEGLAPGATVGEVLEALSARVPALASTLRYTAVARGAELLGRDAVVEDGDHLALIPPVSGG